MQTCQEAAAIRRELEACSRDKDAQIDSLAHQVSGVRGDLMRIDSDIKNMTKEMSEISGALHTIAENTTKISEVIDLYQNLKGFGFVMRHMSKILIGGAAIAAALIYLNGLQFHIGV